MLDEIHSMKARGFDLDYVSIYSWDSETSLRNESLILNPDDDLSMLLKIFDAAGMSPKSLTCEGPK